MANEWMNDPERYNAVMQEIAKAEKVTKRARFVSTAEKVERFQRFLHAPLWKPVSSLAEPQISDMTTRDYLVTSTFPSGCMGDALVEEWIDDVAESDDPIGSINCLIGDLTRVAAALEVLRDNFQALEDETDQQAA